MPDLLSELNPLTGAPDALDGLLAIVGDARFVLIGEASHGTHEFYRDRALLTRRLIETRGFTAVAVEADWPDAYRVNRFVRGQLAGPVGGALGDFTRFPRWMWRNEEVAEFARWLRTFNAAQPQRAAGFYGLDLYSLHRSMHAVVSYLEGVDPEAARRARSRYACFEMFGENPQAYGYATEHGAWDPCEDQATQQLLELQRRAADPDSAGLMAGDELFHAEQNARLARSAEQYYRAMYRGRDDSWNIRDTHMAETLDALAAHLDSQGRAAKVVVWAHNSHLGDARGSAMGTRRGELNLGQLARERWGSEVVIIGQTTAQGEVYAADDWDAPGHVKRVRAPLPGSLEAHLHDLARWSGQDHYWLDLRAGAAAHTLGEEMLQRFIGVIYRPETERWSHYVETHPARQYDALIHVDTTRALRPLDPAGAALPGAEPSDDDLPDTYPSGE
ncbi:erythromycin esterase family protein (plasmid) [Deinococcus taeanensis]|uniref:erythromycin esterase family protein n=1 Tax=Deinococcus taeanensis TaxID=2737050 RepID=UPI001CDCB54F|nr:erythromycin esterase family protein [Deinococcus taeanensis]UBV45066.1 erythromycin esterase family protein [Deinococcus taeanensis]